MSLRRFAAVLARKDQKDSKLPSSSSTSSSLLATLSIPKWDNIRQSDDKPSIAWPEPTRESPYSSATAKASSVSLPEQSTSAPPKTKSQRNFTGPIPRTVSLPSADDFSVPSTTMHKAKTSVSTLLSKATSSVSSLFDDVSVEGSSDGRGKWTKWRGGKTKAKPQAHARSWDFLDRSRAASPPLGHDTDDDDDASSISSEASFLQSVPSGPQADQESSSAPSAIPAVYLPRSHTNLHALTLHSLNYRPAPHPLFNLSTQSKFPRSCNPSHTLSTVPTLRSNLAKTRVLDKLEAQQLTPSENESILPFGRRSLPKPQQDPAETEELKRLSNDGGHSPGLHIWCSRNPFLRRMVQWSEGQNGAEARSPALPNLFSEVQISNGVRTLAGLGPHQSTRRYPVLLSPVDEDETVGGILPPLDRQDINGQLLSLLQLPSVTPSNASSSPPLTPESISTKLKHSLSVEFPDVEEPEIRRLSTESSVYDGPASDEADLLFAMEASQRLDASSDETEKGIEPEASNAKVSIEVETQTVRNESPAESIHTETGAAQDETPPATVTRSRTLRRVAGESKLGDNTKFLQPRLSQIASFWPPSARSPTAHEHEALSIVSEPIPSSSKRPDLHTQRSMEEARPVSRSLAATFDTALPNPALAATSRRIPTAKLTSSSSSTRRPTTTADLPPVPTSPLTTSNSKPGHRRLPSTNGGEEAPPVGSTQSRQRSNSSPKAPPSLSSSPRLDTLYLSTAEGRIIRKVNNAAKIGRSSSVSATSQQRVLSSSRDYGTPPALPRKKSEESQRITTRVNRTLPLPSTSLPSFTDPRLSRQPEPWNDYPHPNMLYRPSVSNGHRRM